MDREHQAHRAGMAHRQQQQPRRRDEEQQGEHGELAPQHLARHRARIRDDLGVHEPRRAQHHQHAAPGAELHGQGEEGMRRLPAEEVVVDRPRRRRREAQEEAVEQRLVEMAPALGEALVEVVAAMPAAAEVAQREDVHRRLARRGGGEGAAHAARLAPVAARAHRHGEDAEAEGERGERDHQPVGNDAEEGAHACMGRIEHRRVLDGRDQDQQQRDAQGREQGDDGPVALEQPAHRRGPGVLRVGLLPQLGEGRGDVDAEGMRRRVLAGVVAALAAMAEVGEVREVRFLEGTAHRHGGEDGAIALAVAAGIADLHLPPGFGDGLAFLGHRVSS